MNCSPTSSSHLTRSQILQVSLLSQRFYMNKLVLLNSPVSVQACQLYHCIQKVDRDQLESHTNQNNYIKLNKTCSATEMLSFFTNYSTHAWQITRSLLALHLYLNRTPTTYLLSLEILFFSMNYVSLACLARSWRDAECALNTQRLTIAI